MLSISFANAKLRDCPLQIINGPTHIQQARGNLGHINATDHAVFRIDKLYDKLSASHMLGYRHSGFSVDTSVRIEAHDRAGWSDCCVTAPVLRCLWSACARRVMSWCTAAPSSTSSLAVIGALTSVVPGQTSSPLRRWS